MSKQNPGFSVHCTRKFIDWNISEDSNSRLRDEKHECYFYAMSPPWARKVIQIWAFAGLFLDFIFFLVHCLYYNGQILTLVIGNRKEEGRVCMHYSLFFLEEAQCPARKDSQHFWIEKAKSVPGFEPGLLRQNVTALPLAPYDPGELKTVPLTLIDVALK